MQAFRWINNPEQSGVAALITHNELRGHFKAGVESGCESLKIFPSHERKETARGCLLFKLRNKSSVLFVPHLVAVDGQGMRATPREE